MCIYIYINNRMKTYFLEHERLVAVHRIDAIVRHDAGAEFLADRVGRQPVHLNVHIGADPLVGEHLTGYDVDGERAGNDAVDGGFGERVERPVGAPHELRL